MRILEKENVIFTAQNIVYNNCEECILQIVCVNARYRMFVCFFFCFCFFCLFLAKNLAVNNICLCVIVSTSNSMKNDNLFFIVLGR